ncbi:MAG: C25 family cysteine peptidase [candidate division WOR-3 bacterium]
MKLGRFVLFLLSSSFLLAQTDGARYLIITHDNYYNALKPLAAWKTQKGYKAKIVKLSEIGNDSTQIKNYIINAYNNWEMKPEYLLLVGNKYQLPFPRMGQTGYGVYYSDNYYTNVTGDFRNEIIPGRLWVFDSSEVKTIVAKILGYERNPYQGDTSWYRKGTTIVNEDNSPPYADSVYWADARFTHQLMRVAGFIHIDSLAESFNNSSIDVINTLNEGRSYFLYRGIGGGTWDVPFSDINIADMNNGFKLPVVISATCATVEIIGYSWLNAGTPEQPKGTVGFFGTTTMLDNAAPMRSALAQGTIQAIFASRYITLGRAAEAGRLNYYQLFGNSLEYDSWTCLGDPELNLWTTTPCPGQILHPGFWFTDSYSVVVKLDQQPVESALVCIMAFRDSTKYYYRWTDRNGCANFYGTLQQPDSGLLTVTGKNLLPFVDTIVGGHSNGPLIIYYKHLILDTIGGNGNYLPNNGENIELAVWLMNIGDSVAYGVQGIIQKDEPDNFYQIADTIKTFGDIPAYDSAFTSENGFDITIHPDCPDSHRIRLKLTLTDAHGQIWAYRFGFLVYSPRPYITLQSYFINDSAGGNNDRKINPGENVELGVWLKNIGDSMAENVTVSLCKEIPDSYFLLVDTFKYFGTIMPQESLSTGEDGFNLLVDTLCPDRHQLRLQIRITDSLDSTWIYNFSLVNYAPKLNYYDYFFNDTLKYILPGETAPLRILIKNAGSAIAHNVVGRLVSLDTTLLVISDSCNYQNILPESIVGLHSSPFIITARANPSPAHPAHLKLYLNGIFYHDSIMVTVHCGRYDYLVWDPDPNHTSGFLIHLQLTNLRYNGQYSRAFPAGYLNIYKSLFVTCGMSPNNYVIPHNSSVISEILDFLNDGNKMYLEGGEVWYYDPSHGGFDFRPYFCIISIANNIGYFTGVSGCESTFTRLMSFNYTGEASSIDRISPDSGGVAIFKNRYNNYVCGVAAQHRTIGLSLEFGGLVDSLPPSTKRILADSIMRYFNIEPSNTVSEKENAEGVVAGGIELYPNPFREHCIFRYHNSHEVDTFNLAIYDVAGRLVRSFPGVLTNQKIIWDGRDGIGRRVPAGIFFVVVNASKHPRVLKAVLLR